MMKFATILSTLVVLATSTADAAKFNKTVDVGSKAPAFENLKGVDGETHSMSDYNDAKALVLIFTCNHCPVAQAYEQRFKDLAGKYKGKGVEVVGVSISLEPSDTLEKMAEKAKEEDFNFAYVQDPSQEYGKKLGASATPHVFVLDQERKIAYMGAFDSDINQSRAKYKYVPDAVEALLAGREIEVPESKPVGCPIQYERK